MEYVAIFTILISFPAKGYSIQFSFFCFCQSVISCPVSADNSVHVLTGLRPRMSKQIDCGPLGCVQSRQTEMVQMKKREKRQKLQSIY